MCRRATNLIALSAVVSTLLITNVDAQTFRQQGARRGAVAGAVVGGLIGGKKDRPVLGIVVGGVGGSLMGQALGQQRDNEIYQQNYRNQNFGNQYFRSQPYFPSQPNLPQYQSPQYYPNGQIIYPGQAPNFLQQPQIMNPPMQTWSEQYPPTSSFGGSNIFPRQSQAIQSMPNATEAHSILVEQPFPRTGQSQAKKGSLNSNQRQVQSSNPSNTNNNLLSIDSSQSDRRFGQVRQGTVQTGRVQTGQYSPTTRELNENSGGNVQMRAPQPLNQPYTHGW